MGEVRGATRGLRDRLRVFGGGLGGDELVKGYGDTQIRLNEGLGVIN